ncbi:hypothetical protein Q5752_003888 [Cryptotrichosporon argae]
MSTNNANPSGRKGKRASSSASTSPTLSLATLPRIKLNVRPATPVRSARPRASSSRQRTASGALSDASSDLTPAEDDDEDDAMGASEIVTPRRKKVAHSASAHGHGHGSGRATPTSKGKGKAAAPPPAPAPADPGAVKPLAVRTVSASGPGGRQKKRAIKLGEVARRRARDDKLGFGAGQRFGDATPTQHMYDSDATSSYGDDESEQDADMAGSFVPGDETDEEVTAGLPEAFAGQEIEDLAYGAGQVDFGVEEEAEHEWWQEQEDEEDFVAQLSGSDIDQLQSQSSVGGESDDPMTDSDSADSDGAMDEFGFPVSSFNESTSPAAEGPLILMENWDGQFVLVQPKQDRSDRSRSRHRTERGTAGSVGGSTTVSAGEQALVIDPEADGEGYASSSSGDWGASDDDGGDTTDSMAEEDMPLLDSPALDQIIEQQLANATGFPLGLDCDTPARAPAIVVTDHVDAVSAGLASAPPMSAAPLVTSPLAAPPLAAAPPATPVVAPPPLMGTFLPLSDDPCSHAVIDGSKTATKSPFTRRRRSGDSSAAAAAAKRQKRKTTPAVAAADPFSPAAFQKKLRYSSIPGHPRYIAARRAALGFDDRESTESDDEDMSMGGGDGAGFSLEDMLHADVLGLPDDEAEHAHGAHGHGHGHHGAHGHVLRFDKVPVSMYMRRNMGRHAALTSPVARGRLALSETLTLAAPLGGRALVVSPVLAAQGDEPRSRKDRRRLKRRDEMAPLEI